MASLALVGCGDEKADRRVEAKRLYTSDYFKNKRYWAEGCDSWRILSAKYGLIEPDDVIDEYDKTLSDMDDDAIDEWAEDVVSDLDPLLEEVETVFILAGEDYFCPLESALADADVTVERPLAGKRIGEQKKWLSTEPRPDQQSITDYE